MPPSLTGRSPTCRISSTPTAATTSSCREVLGAGRPGAPAPPGLPQEASMPPPIALHPVSVRGNVFADCEIQKVWDENGTLYLAGAHHDGRVSVEMRQLTDEGERLWGTARLRGLSAPSKGLPPWESTMSLAMRTGSSTTSIIARNSAPPPLRGAVLRMPF